MTLIELLVAFMVFVMLVGALVSLAINGLDTWTRGESQKDIYDRIQAILDIVAEDLRNTYVENDWGKNARPRPQPPAMICDSDKNKRVRLRFVRTGRPVNIGIPRGKSNLSIPANNYTDAWEVAYVMDSDPEKSILYRGVRYFDRKSKGSLFDKAVVGNTQSARFKQRFAPIDDGVLYLGYKLWSQYTTTWDETKRVKVTRRRRSSRAIGPSMIWDSTRRELSRFFLHRSRTRLNDPDFVYPEMIQVSLTLESTTQDARGAELGSDLDEKVMILSVSTTRGMPDAPNFILVGNEWMEYKDLGHSEITLRRRGVRGTKIQKHKAGERVRFGPNFVAQIYIPVYRECVRSK